MKAKVTFVYDRNEELPFEMTPLEARLVSSWATKLVKDRLAEVTDLTNISPETKTKATPSRNKKSLGEIK